MINVIYFALSLAVIFPSGIAIASDEKHGWFWYEPIVIEDSTEKKEINEFTEKERQPLPPPPSIETLMAWHPDDIKHSLEEYHKQAIWKPTPENLKNYLQLEEVALRKSVAMAAVKAYVVQTTPALDLNKDYPRNSVGQDIYYTNRNETMRQYLHNQKKNYGLVYFVEESCQYCVMQDAIIQSFVERYGFNIAVVDVRRNAVAAQRFNVSFTPQTIIVERKSKQWMSVATGVAPITSLEENSYRAIRMMRKEIQPEQFYTMGAEGNRALDPMRREIAP